MGHVWRKQSVCLVFCKMLVLGFGFLFHDKYSFIVCGLFFFRFWCFTKGYALWNSESFWLADVTELIVPTVTLLYVVCPHRQSPARMGRLGRGGSLSCGLLSVLSSEKQDLHAALHTSVLHFLWLVTNHIRLEDAWPELSLQGCVRAGKGIFCAEFFKSWSVFMVSWVSLPQFK